MTYYVSSGTLNLTKPKPKPVITVVFWTVKVFRFNKFIRPTRKWLTVWHRLYHLFIIIGSFKLLLNLLSYFCWQLIFFVVSGRGIFGPPYMSVYFLLSTSMNSCICSCCHNMILSLTFLNYLWLIFLRSATVRTVLEAFCHRAVRACVRGHIPKVY